jgi:hypothetical protein
MPQDVKKVNNLSISNVETPDYFVPTSKETPDYFVPNDVKTEEKTENSDILNQISKRIFEAPEFITKGAKDIANKIDPGGTTPSGGFLDTINAIPDVARNLISNPMETMRGGLAGMTEGAASLLSPANITTTLMPEGKVLSGINKGIGAFQGVHGFDKIRQGKFAEGIGDIGFGTLGMFGGKSKKKINETETKLVNPEYFEPKSIPESITDETGKIIAPAQNFAKERPEGPWNSNVSSDLKKKSAEEIQYELARNKFNMGRDLPNDGPKKPFIKDYWIEDKDGKKILNPKYQFGKGINEIQAKFKGWQPDGEGGHFALYDIHDPNGGPLDRSTVSEKSLKSAGIAIPETPEFSKANPERDAAIARQKSLQEGKSNPTLANLFNDETGAVRFGSNKQQPIKPSTKSLRQPSDEVVGKLIDALTEAGPKRALQERGYSIERAKRFAAADKVTATGLPGFYKQLHELKGELPKVDFGRTKISPADLNDLINYVTNSPYLLTGE